jgi:hypothetical protein
MRAPVEQEQQRRYLVELRRPTRGWWTLEDVAARARASATDLSGRGTPVRFLRTVFVPEDESCYLLIEAPSGEAAAEVARGGALAVVRVDPVQPVEGRET